jgi:hypothetical protein
MICFQVTVVWIVSLLITWFDGTLIDGVPIGSGKKRETVEQNVF